MKRWVIWMAAALAVLSVAASPVLADNFTGGGQSNVIRIRPAVAVPLCDTRYYQLINNVCVPKPVAVPLCGGAYKLVNNVCVLTPCPKHFVHGSNGYCVPPAPPCAGSHELFMGLCVWKCPSGQHHTQPNGACAG